MHVFMCEERKVVTGKENEKKGVVVGGGGCFYMCLFYTLYTLIDIYYLLTYVTSCVQMKKARKNLANVAGFFS